MCLSDAVFDEALDAHVKIGESNERILALLSPVAPTPQRFIQACIYGHPSLVEKSCIKDSACTGWGIQMETSLSTWPLGT